MDPILEGRFERIVIALGKPVPNGHGRFRTARSRAISGPLPLPFCATTIEGDDIGRERAFGLVVKRADPDQLVTTSSEICDFVVVQDVLNGHPGL